MLTETEIRRAAELVYRADRIVAFTGAGLSTASGIPDFRSAEDGLWKTQDPMEVATLSGFRSAPERFYEWARPVAARISAASPNPAHLALRALERPGKHLTVITQNIDDLHNKAGSSRVIELHGNFRTLICTGCRRTHTAADAAEPPLPENGVPRCPDCRCVLKPSAILFGEELPYESWRTAEAACLDCDLMIVAGTSLEVHPAARLPKLAADHLAPLITINATPIPIDHAAAVVLRGRVEAILPAIAAEVQARG
ncbi:MAG TPA: NAD-dependent deacylase [Anaerolineales bacterium]|nr:NAD-dependent deacylase [Anaerolineales bacterium]